MRLSTVLTVGASSFGFASAQSNATNNNYSGVSPGQRYNVNATQARTIIEGAIRQANSLGIPFNIAVTDPGANLVAFHRMDNAFLGQVDRNVSTYC